MDYQNYLSEHGKKIETSEIRKLFDLAAKLENPIDLSIGQPDFPVPEPVIEAYIKALRENKNGYTPTQGIAPLREAIAEKWKQGGVEIEPRNILVSAGVASLLYLLYDALFDTGDQIVVVEPYFVIYQTLGVMHGLDIRYLPENFSQEDIDRLVAEPGFSPKAVIFSSPSNPTGKIIEKGQLQLLAPIVERYRSILISDEIYSAYDYQGKFVSTASIYPENTITLGGFSKSHAMTGLRVGYLGVPVSMEPLLQKVAAMQQYSIVCSPQPAQWAAVTALHTSITPLIEKMKSRRDLIAQPLSEVAEVGSPDGAFYLFVRTPVDGGEFARKAIEKELLVVPGHIFSRDPNYVRVSYAQKEETLQKGLSILVGLLESLPDEK